MGPSNAVEPLGTHQGQKKVGRAKLQDAKPLSSSEQMPTRQCDRGRQFFPDPSASLPAKWWACPTCHDKLFGAA
jgi:hypothetical protein